jgi:hypothetical protein
MLPGRGGEYEGEGAKVGVGKERVLVLFSGLFLNTASSSSNNNSAGVKKGRARRSRSCGGEDFKVTLGWEQDRGAQGWMSRGKPTTCAATASR